MTYQRRVGSSPASSKITSPAIMPSPPRRFSSPTKKSALYSDRFIPNRASSHLDDAFDLMDQAPYNQRNSTGDKDKSNSKQAALNNMIRNELLGLFPTGAAGSERPISQGGGHSASPASGNVLRYRSSLEMESRASYDGPSSSMSSFSPMGPSASISHRLSYTDSKKTKRKISRIAYKVLDAPALQDDFYLNLVDWSASNILAVGLSSCVYLWSANTSKVFDYYFN